MNICYRILRSIDSGMQSEHLQQTIEEQQKRVLRTKGAPSALSIFRTDRQSVHSSIVEIVIGIESAWAEIIEPEVDRADTGQICRDIVGQRLG